MKESNPTAKGQSTQNSFYNDLHSAKKLCIVWDTGRKMLFYYSYLIAVDFNLTDDLNVMTLQFMAHLVTLKGYRLDLLFSSFLGDEPHIITVKTQRYAGIDPENKPFVIEATIEK
jgi:hypothetical protein